MDLLAVQPYSKVHREITSTGKIEVEQRLTIYLYTDRVVTKHREFPIEEVLDVSYRVIGGDGGLLYLHTSSGLFPFNVKTSPKDFMDVFKGHRDAGNRR